MRTWFILAAIMFTAVLPLQAQDEEPASNKRNDVYYTEAEAREKVFGEALIWRDTVIQVDSSARARLREASGLSESDSAVTLWYSPGQDGAPVGVYRVASEMGKHSPFDFLVGLDEELTVKGIVVMTYREARGGDVRRARFLKQFQGKAAGDPVSVNRDIIGISGATISSRAVTRGVRKTLWWAHEIWPGNGGESE